MNDWPTQADPQRAPYVFVSYASVDRDKILPVVQWLRSADVQVWVDLDDIGGGANYGSEIVEAIKGCRAFLLMCTPAALASRNVRQEIQLAWKHDRRYLPLLIEPTVFTSEVQYWLEGSQWIEVLDQPVVGWLRKVLKALERLEKQAPARRPTSPSAAPSAATVPLSQTPATTPWNEDAQPTIMITAEQAASVRSVHADVAAPARFDPDTLKQIETELALHIGPIATILVRRGAGKASSLAQLAELVGAEINDARVRAAFVNKLAGAVGSIVSGNPPTIPKEPLS